MNETTVQSAPWYRHPWVWFLICLPLSAVAFGIVMIVSANHQPDDLVVDNYYKEGMGINRRLELDRRAVDIGAGLKLNAITDTGAVFQLNHASDNLKLAVFHVSDSSQDLEVPLLPTSDGIYVAGSEKLSSLLRQDGIWYIEVRDNDNGWRLRERIHTPLTELEINAG